MTKYFSSGVIKQFRSKPKAMRERQKSAKLREKLDAIKAENERKKLQKELALATEIKKIRDRRERKFNREQFGRKVKRFSQADFNFKHRIKRNKFEAEKHS